VYSADIERGSTDINGRWDAIRNCRFAQDALAAESIEHMVAQLEQSGRRYRCITICGHAAEGNQSIGGTYEPGEARVIRSADHYQPQYDLLADHLQDVAALLTRLRAVMEAGGVLFLAGCAVAKGREGRKLLRQVSQLMRGVWVVGIEIEVTEYHDKKKNQIEIMKADEQGKLIGKVAATDIVMALDGKITNEFPADISPDEMMQGITIWPKS
jgi:hypothetical protein